MMEAEIEVKSPCFPEKKKFERVKEGDAIES